MSNFLFGRQPRGHNTSIPAMFQLTAGTTLPPIPQAWDWAVKGNLPTSLGAMLNDTLGDCTCAAIGHAIQLFTANTSTMFTVPDPDILYLYEQACGYNPANPATDQGGSMQTLLHYWQYQGVPRNSAVNIWDKIVAYIEIDPTNQLQMDRAIYECGGVYAGINVQSSLMNTVGGQPPDLWTYDPTCTTIAGGHAIWLTGYDDGAQEFSLISWGTEYKMTYQLNKQLTDEAYAVISRDFLEANGVNPLGLTLADWQNIADGIQAQ